LNTSPKDSQEKEWEKQGAQEFQNYRYPYKEFQRYLKKIRPNTILLDKSCLRSLLKINIAALQTAASFRNPNPTTIIINMNKFTHFIAPDKRNPTFRKDSGESLLNVGLKRINQRHQR
jgi:hypothetical protein